MLLWISLFLPTFCRLVVLNELLVNHNLTLYHFLATRPPVTRPYLFWRPVLKCSHSDTSVSRSPEIWRSSLAEDRCHKPMKSG